ncbi:MAG: hypothetical protein HQ492_01840 [Woeseiaceae bacterium]|nr:hypothetical protein [Woeseiaceae bacterium]
MSTSNPAAGQACEELGATASDDIDGHVTDRIVVSPLLLIFLVLIAAMRAKDATR